MMQKMYIAVFVLGKLVLEVQEKKLTSEENLFI